MRDFGRQLVAADLLGQSGSPSPEDIARAVAGVQAAVVGVDQLMSQTCQGELEARPVFRSKTAAERQEYRRRFERLLNAFRRLLVQYQDLIQAQPLNTASLAQTRDQLRAIAAAAHRIL